MKIARQSARLQKKLWTPPSSPLFFTNREMMLFMIHKYPAIEVTFHYFVFQQ